MDIRPMDAALGAEVRCADLRELDDAQVARLRQAWLDHLVILVRGQEMSDAELVAFGRRFGEFQVSRPLPSPLAREGKVRQGGADERHPEVTIVSNIVENGVAVGGLGDGELVWHSDMSSFAAPPNQTILHALEVPTTGGDTGFNNMYLAWETLPVALRARVEGLQLKHDATVDAAGYVREPFVGMAEDLRSTPGAVHPLVRTHPETGRHCLYLGRRTRACLMGLELPESEALLDALWAHATQPALQWFHRWRPGDLLMWDNRCVMHRREPFDPAARRKLHRVVIRGLPPARVPGEAPRHPRGLRAGVAAA